MGCPGLYLPYLVPKTLVFGIQLIRSSLDARGRLVPVLKFRLKIKVSYLATCYEFRNKRGFMLSENRINHSAGQNAWSSC